MKRIALLLLAVVMIPTVAFAGSNLLATNASFDDSGGIEGGSVGAWTEQGTGAKAKIHLNSREQQGTVHSLPHSAEFDSTNKLTNEEVLYSLFQDFSDVTVGEEYTGSCWLLNLSQNNPIMGGASAWVGLEWWNATGMIGSTEKSPLLTAANDAWQLFSVTSTAPTGATFGRFLLSVDAPGWGNGNNMRSIYFDDASVTTAPEPVSSALFLLGAGAMVVRRIRKKA